MKKLDYLSKFLLASIFCSSVFVISCTNEDTDAIEETFEEQSVSSVTLSAATARTGVVYKFGHVDGRPIELEVEDYNENFTYELKFTGSFFKEEYNIELTKKNTSSTIIKEDVEVAKLAKTQAFVPVTETNVTTLVADVENLDMLSDEYTVQLLEKESNTYTAVIGFDTDYVIVDNDATSFLSGTQLESLNWVKLTELDLNETTFRVRPTIVNYVNGIGVRLAIYDLDLKLIGTVNSNGSNGVRGRGTYSYKFLTTSVNDLIPENGTYYFRLEESKHTNDASDKVYKNALFQKMPVIKKSTSTVSDSNDVGSGLSALKAKG